MTGVETYWVEVEIDPRKGVGLVPSLLAA